MATSDPFGRHDWHSPQYVEEWIASATQRDEERRSILRRVVSLIPHAPDAAIRVLDVGAGYGALSAQVLEYFPRAQVVCQDFSEPMFAHARQQLAWASARVTFSKSDLGEGSWTSALTGPFDAVVSAIAIHNVRYVERIRAIYTDIFGLIGADGCFLNYDLIFPSGRIAAEAYRRAQSRGGWRQTRSSTQSSAEARYQAGGHAPHGHAHREGERSTPGAEPATLENQLRWLREAGFQDVECFWKEGTSAIIGGYRVVT